MITQNQQRYIEKVYDGEANGILKYSTIKFVKDEFGNLKGMVEYINLEECPTEETNIDELEKFIGEYIYVAQIIFKDWETFQEICHATENETETKYVCWLHDNENNNQEIVEWSELYTEAIKLKTCFTNW